jgi:putative phosphoribosyl transferase
MRSWPWGLSQAGGARWLQPDVLAAFSISQSMIEATTERELQELQRREQSYRDSRATPVVQGQTVILVDDGLATGSTMRVAVAALKEQGPKYIVVAVPVAARETCNQLNAEVDEVICAETPDSFSAVGLWYEDFSQVTDDEVRDLLSRADQSHKARRLQ